MPPSPTIKITVNQGVLDLVCSELNIRNPTIRVIQRGGHILGQYDSATHHIKLMAGVDEQQRGRLPFVQSECVRTLLHELRHGYQYAHWTADQLAKGFAGEYNARPAEADAEEYAHSAISRFKMLVSVRRQFHGSAFSKLDATQATVRRRV